MIATHLLTPLTTALLPFHFIAIAFQFQLQIKAIVQQLAADWLCQMQQLKYLYNRKGTKRRFYTNKRYVFRRLTTVDCFLLDHKRCEITQVDRLIGGQCGDCIYIKILALDMHIKSGGKCIAVLSVGCNGSVCLP